LGRTGKFILPIEAGVRQGISYSTQGSDDWVFSTRVYNDWSLVRFGNLELLAGGSFGAVYGNTPIAWTVAPEVVGKVHLKDDGWAFVRVDYPFDIGRGRSVDSLNYTLGLGFSW